MSASSAQEVRNRFQKLCFILFAALMLLLFSLPVHAERLPELIKMVKPADVFPGATRFGPPEGKPMTAKV